MADIVIALACGGPALVVFIGFLRILTTDTAPDIFTQTDYDMAERVQNARPLPSDEDVPQATLSTETWIAMHDTIQAIEIKES